jgi:hypothetical protein
MTEVVLAVSNPNPMIWGACKGLLRTLAKSVLWQIGALAKVLVSVELMLRYPSMAPKKRCI